MTPKCHSIFDDVIQNEYYANNFHGSFIAMRMLFEMMQGTGRTVWLKTKKWEKGKQWDSEQMLKMMHKLLINRWYDVTKEEMNRIIEVSEISSKFHPTIN
jgi:hypothetical protein